MHSLHNSTTGNHGHHTFSAFINLGGKNNFPVNLFKIWTGGLLLHGACFEEYHFNFFTGASKKTLLPISRFKKAHGSF